MQAKRRARRGFSLVELLAVVLIIAIAAIWSRRARTWFTLN